MTDKKQTSESTEIPVSSGEDPTPETSTNQTSEASPEASATEPMNQGEAEKKPEDSKAAKAEEYYNQLVRTLADFDNFKKRAARERTETARYACTAMLERLLPVLDNLEMAMAAAEKAQDDSMESLKTGVSMVLQQFKTALRESGMEEIEAAGQPFDPNLHEAVSQQETGDVPEGHITLQLRRGYKLHDRLLRPASVVVAKAPSADQSTESADQPSQ